jgi:5-methylcytosine-specific restriction endonuclease McrA
MTEKPKLTIELVPSTCWYSNVRSNVLSSEWDIIRKKVYKNAGYVCEVCGGRGDKHPVECHEIWEYNETDLTQRLNGFIALCPSCHEVKHIGLARIKGRELETLQHLAKVNNWSETKAKSVISYAFREWERRSRIKWLLDVSYIDTFVKDQVGL